MFWLWGILGNVGVVCSTELLDSLKTKIIYYRERLQVEWPEATHQLTSVRGSKQMWLLGHMCFLCERLKGWRREEKWMPLPTCSQTLLIQKKKTLDESQRNACWGTVEWTSRRTYLRTWVKLPGAQWWHAALSCFVQLFTSVKYNADAALIFAL